MNTKPFLNKLFFTTLSFLLSIVVFSQEKTAPKYFVFEENNQKGLVNIQGETVLELSDDISEDDGYFFVKKKDTYSVYDPQLKLIFKGNYQYVTFGSNKTQFIVLKNEKYGVVTAQNKVIIPIKYDDLDWFQNGYIVGEQGKKGILNLQGKQLIPIVYKNIEISSFDKNTPIAVENDQNKWGFINYKNKWVIEPQYKYARSFKNGLSLVRGEKENYIIDVKGNIIITSPDRFEVLPSGNIKIIVGYKGGKYTIYNTKGELLKTYEGFSYNHYNNNDIHRVEENGKYGFINNEGKEVIPLEYDDAWFFSEGLAPVMKNGKWGYVNLKNELVIDFQFVGAMEHFKNGVAEYRKGNISKSGYTWGTTGLIDKTGKIIAQPKYKEIHFVEGNVAIVTIDGQKYLYDFVKEQKIKRLSKDDHIYMIEGAK